MLEPAHAYAIDCLKEKTVINNITQVGVANITRSLVISSNFVVHGTISSLGQFYWNGIAYFMVNNMKITTQYNIKELFIDEVPWHKAFSKQLIHVGMPIILDDFQYCAVDCSYVACGVISVKLSDCWRDVYRTTPWYTGSYNNQQNGVIFSIAKNGFSVVYPLIVVAIINGEKENIYVGENATWINGVRLQEYQMFFPADYFKVGMTVNLRNTQKCNQKTVKCSSYNLFCKYVANVVCFEEKLCLVDLLRAHRNATLAQSIMDIFNAALAILDNNVEKDKAEATVMKPAVKTQLAAQNVALPNKVPASYESKPQTIVHKNDIIIPKKPKVEDEPRVTVEDDTRHENAGGKDELKTVSVKVELIKMVDGDKQSSTKCEMGTQTFITGKIVTSRLFLE